MVAGRAFARSAASTEVRVLELFSTASRAPRACSRCALPSARVASPIAVVVVVAALKKSPSAIGAWPSCVVDLAALGAATADCFLLSKPARADLPSMLASIGPATIVSQLRPW